MERSSQSMDRRDFLKSAALVGGTAALTGLAGCGPTAPAAETGETPKTDTPAPTAPTQTSFPTTEEFLADFPLPEPGIISFVADPIPADQIASEVQTEVLIIGAGIAGACVAASATENGLKPTILEKTDSFAFHGYDICAWGDKVHKAAGLTDTTPEELVKALIDLSEWRADYRLFTTWAYNCNEAVDWLIDTLDGQAGEPFVPWSHGNVDMVDTKWYGTAIKFPGEMKTVVPTMLAYAESKGAEIIFNTPAVQLVKEGDAVVGAIAETTDGYVKYTASNAVVLCTGSYDRNPDRLLKYMKPRDLASAGWFNETIGDTGDGHEMGLAVGGIEDEYPHTLMTGTTQYIGLLRVNNSGYRYTPEFISATLLLNALQNQLGGYAWIIADGNGLEALNKTRGDYSNKTAEEQFEDLGLQGLTADTLEDLAAQMEIPANNLVETVNRYNELCAKGKDEDYNVPAERLSAIGTPPFYALKEKARMLTTVSGLRITEKSEVISKDTKVPIPGLYAVGNVSGGMFVGSYAHNVSGVSHSRCITYGYLLGKRLAGKL